jgi:hypothetical protein
MHTPLLRLAALLLASTAMASATPDHTISIEETLVGTSESEYAILRTEIDNLGNHYSSCTKRFLDEYAKDGEGHFESATPRLLRSRLLLSVQNIRNPEKSTEANVVGEKDASISFADLLVAYPASARPWDTTSFQRLSSHQTGGICLDGRVCLLDGGFINSQIFGNRYPGVEWKLVEVLQDANILYLKLSKGGADEVSEIKLVGIPPRWSRQVMDHLWLKPFYLIAGTYPTLEDARTQAAALEAKIRSNPGTGYHPEIWSVQEASLSTVFVIADSNSAENIQGDRFKNLETRLGVDLTVRSSERFQEKWSLVPPEPPAKAMEK